MNYKNGLPYGKLTHWHLNGIPKATAYYQEGLPVGKSQMWDPSGKLLEVIQWEKGRPWNATIYKSDGTPFKAIGLKRGNGVLPWQSFIRSVHNEFYSNWKQEPSNLWNQEFLITEADDMIHFLNGYRVKQGKEITWENNMQVANLTSQSTECKFIDGKPQGVEIKFEKGRIVQNRIIKKEHPSRPDDEVGLRSRWSKINLVESELQVGILDGNCTWWSYQKQTNDWSKYDLYLQLITNDFSEEKTPRYSKNDSITRRATLKMGVLHGVFTQWVEENKDYHPGELCKQPKAWKMDSVRQAGKNH